MTAAATRPRELLFVGVGKMGLPMAGHLHAAGHRVSACDAAPQRRALAATAGLIVIDTLDMALAALPRDGALIFSSLPDDAALLAVAAAIAAHAPSGACWVDASTVSPQASADAAARVAARGVDCLRTPVSGNNTASDTDVVQPSADVSIMLRPTRSLWPMLSRTF